MSPELISNVYVYARWVESSIVQLFSPSTHNQEPYDTLLYEI